MNRFISMKIGYEKAYNPDLPDDLWTRQGIVVCGKDPYKPPASMTVHWGGQETVITDPDVCALFLELSLGVRSLKAKLKKWEETGET